MDFTPSRRTGAALGLFFLLLLLAGILVGILQLASAEVTAWIILWVLFPILGVPLALLVGYRLYGLFSARYRLDRDGFYLTWGLASEQIPLAEIERVQPAEELAPDLRPGRGFWWPGCVVGKRRIDGVGEVEFFATRGAEGLLILHVGERLLAISPPDTDTFYQSFVDAARMGSLERIAARSQRPDFTFGRLWGDPVARLLVLAGLVVSLVLLGYLALQVPALPPQVPFGFNSAGAPDTFAPPGRLLLLPMIGGFCWLVDLVVGAWLYRKEADRLLAYTIWLAGMLVGGLLWVAVLQLLAAA